MRVRVAARDTDRFAASAPAIIVSDRDARYSKNMYFYNFFSFFLFVFGQTNVANDVRIYRIQTHHQIGRYENIYSQLAI